ncbi:MAG: efflux transporter outer membrane subunit [Sedimentisphaerales bacterium]|nr:efflux transporter outer membrane subunit [Sedimentisphaerales bacterium]
MNVLYKLLASLLMILTLAGCAPAGPDYIAPETSVPETWHSQLKAGLVSEEMNPQMLASWWTSLSDPELSSLIERAVAGNLDLKKAQARVIEARARRGIANADKFPTLNFSGSETWTRSSKEVGTGKTTELYSANFDSGWEIDIFGSVRRSVEATEADLQASQEDLHDVLVSLLAEVALNYVEVRTYQARLETVERNLEAQNETYQLTLWRNQAGLSDELAVQQARYTLESTRSQIPGLHTGLEEAMNRIAVLVGEQPGKVHKELEKIESIPVPPSQTAVGIPAETIRRRPDVRQAERKLAAQTARVGVAAAELYPKFSLSGSIGVEALSFNKLARNLTTSDSWVLSGGPRISWAIFDAGAIRQNIKVQSALQEQSLIEYESTILGALEDVENALVAYADEQSKLDNLRQAEQAAQTAVELAQHKYESGLTDFSDVLEAQRSLLSFQDQMAQSNGTVTSNLIRLYKALGGGWTTFSSEEKQLTGVKK